MRIQSDVFSVLVLVALGSVAAGALAGPARADCPDLALVLAVDASGSIGPEEFSVQRDGYSRALLSAPVQAALASAGVVDVAMVLWGDAEMAPQVLDWHRLRRPADTEVLAARIAGMARQVTGDTGIGAGIWAALELLEASCGARRLINVSGDGRETLNARPRRHVPLALARDRAAAAGITINALAIAADDPDLAQWYAKRVIVGPGAFVMEVTGFDSFAEAIQRKLGREIALPVLATLPQPAHEREWQ